MRALIVTDDPAATEILAREARNFQFQPDIFRELDAAVQAFRERQHQLVLTTFGLGSVSGVDVCREIRKPEPRSRALIVVAAAAETDVEAILEAGADDYVIFPAEARTLWLRMRVATRRVHDRQESARIENDLRLS